MFKKIKSSFFYIIDETYYFILSQINTYFRDREITSFFQGVIITSIFIRYKPINFWDLLFMLIIYLLTEWYKDTFCFKEIALSFEEIEEFENLE